MATYEEEILSVISAILHRINASILWKYISICILISMSLCISILFIDKFTPIPIFITNVSIVMIGISLIIGIIIGISKRKSLLDVAIITDKAFNLKDRLGSSLEIINGRKLSALIELQLEDTVKHINNIDPKLVCPRLIPKIAYVLPIGVIILFSLWLSPVFYGEPAEVRQIIQQSGIGIEEEARELINLSNDSEKLISKIIDVGKKLQEKNISKKEALRRISNVSREVEAMKLLTEISNELKGEISPDKKRKLNEILEKLSELLKDIPEMSDLAQKVTKVQQMNLSDETLKELARALENRRLSSSGLSALQRISDRLQKEKQDITKTIASVYPVRSTDSGNTKETQSVAGATGDSAPSKDVTNDKETQETTEIKRIDSKGKMTELEGQLSSKGQIITTEITMELEKGVSTIPYEELYIKYKSAANDAISTQNIPITYRNQVKAYFDAINPNRKGNINERNVRKSGEF